jgi:serine protease Do
MTVFRLVLIAFAALQFSSEPIHAQQRPAGYAEAEAAFKRLSSEERVRAQILMIASGQWNAVPNLDFSARVFEAIKRLQTEMGKEPTGAIGLEELGQLEKDSAVLLKKWGFRQVRHPDRPISIWVPFGLNLTLEKEKFGLSYANLQKTISITFYNFDNLELTETYRLRLQSINERGGNAHWAVIRPQFYVIASSTPNGIDSYERYHRDGRGIIGFRVSWLSSDTETAAGRIATLMSASLWGQYNRLPMGPPEQLVIARFQRVAPPNPPASEQRPSPASNDAPPKREEQGASTGTGFFVSASGHVVTNAHVVDNCLGIEVRTAGGTKARGRVIARDTINDVALLGVDGAKPEGVGLSRSGVRLGEQVAAFGFPLSGLLSTSGNFTIGNITSLAGLGDDSRYLQISTPVQAGNSGGPLLDQSGNVVGIVTSKLNVLRTAVRTGDMPQNVNFALKIGVVANLIEAHGFQMQSGIAERSLTPAEIAETAKKLSVQITCERRN